MEERELIRTFIEKPAHSVDLYFTIKDGDILKQYKVDCSNELKKEIIDGYLTELKKHFNQDSPYKIYSVYDDNERSGAILYEDSIKTNLIAQQVFKFKKTDVEIYNKDVGDYNSIFGFLIILSDGDFEVGLFKKSLPFQALKRNKYFALIPGANDRFNIIV